jgi:predicted nucleotidyltransferase
MLEPYDFVLSTDDFLFVVKNYENVDKCVIALPKYIPYKLTKIKFMGHYWKMLGGQWSRISNFSELITAPGNNFPYFSKYKICDGGFLIKKKNIKRIFKAKQGIKQILTEKEKQQNKIRKTSATLIKILKKATSEKNLGLTGSSLLKGEIENFSDIDLVVYGSKAYKKISKFLKSTKIAEIHLRTKKEWKNFYEHYKVISPMSKEKFASHALSKCDQFIILGTPATIFAVRSNSDMKLYLKHKKSKITKIKSITINAVVSDDKESMFLPSIYQIKTEGYGKCLIYNQNRSFIFQAQKGDKCVVLI